MALRTPPSWLQNASHPAENDRLSTQAIYATTGIVGSSSLAVTQSSPAAMSVQVAAGWAAIVGTTQANMGTYVAYNDAAAALSITTADVTNPRVDRVVVTINDAFYVGATNNVAFQVIAGTPAGSPVAPATPANSISLATIAVGAAVTQINTGNITDTRTNVTTNLPVGDLTEVQGGTGITVTSPTGPIPSVAIDATVVATLTGTQTLTNKTLTSPTLNDPKINLTFDAETATYTAILANNGQVVTMDNAGAHDFLIPTNANVAFPVGTQINVIQKGAGQTTIKAVTSGTTTINSTGASATAPKLRARYSAATCIKEATDTWYVVGDIA